ncbi:MAG: C39 family peptidase [Bacteroidota bacterium]|nr:C39 family peptidase [Bacteroidota bacterium]
MNIRLLISIYILVLTPIKAFSQNYPDQQIIIKGSTDLFANIEESENVVENGNTIELADGALEGYFILKPQSASNFFNRGLPSWNGHAPEDQSSSFKVLMRFKVNNLWQRWVTVGYWDKEIWPSYGYTTFTGGNVAIDYVKLDYYIKEFQFKVLFKRNSVGSEAPSVKQLGFFVSDSRTTDDVSVNTIVNDNPGAIYIPTEFIYQSAVDPVIGGSICSPASTSMVLRSYDIEVEPYEFALRTKDQYWGIFGVWPRAVQHAHEYGLEGSVTRYRNWSETYEILNAGGRIVISVGQPLSSAGHLIMLAGFDNNGNPIVHNSAYSNGEAYMHDKYDITKAWFEKGGISYTFYDSTNSMSVNSIDSFKDRIKIFPNPVEDVFTLSIDHNSPKEKLHITILDAAGLERYRKSEILSKGENSLKIDLHLIPGLYFLKIRIGNNTVVKKIIKF